MGAEREAGRGKCSLNRRSAQGVTVIVFSGARWAKIMINVIHLSVESDLHIVRINPIDYYELTPYRANATLK